MLLEIIAPKSTLEDDILYIAGEFNGGIEAAAEDPIWQFEKSTTVNGKWGLYLDPSSFIGGKTLADGYCIVSTMQGEERTSTNKEVIRTDAPEVGGRLVFYISNWKSFFNPPQAVEHTGSYVIYVEDNTGWGSLNLYSWGESPNFEAFGGWPGMAPTGTEKINGKTYLYFDVPEEAAGTEANLIFNNNDGSQTPDIPITINRNILLSITGEGGTELELESEHYFWITNQNPDWAEIALYSWGTINDVLGGWPGGQPTGKTITVKGLTYQQFAMPAQMIGTECNLIVNNNGQNEQAPDVAITPEPHDYFFMVVGKTMTEVNPRTAELPEAEEPDDPTKSQFKIYVDNQLGWTPLTVHIFAGETPYTEWPGIEPKKDVTVGEFNLKQFLVPVEAEGQEISLIFNNNGAGAQTEAINVVLDKDIYIKLASTIDEFTPDLDSQFAIYIEDKSGWESTNLYCWGDKEVFGGWPGAVPVDEVTIGGITYKRFTYLASAEGSSVNLIINNNNGLQTSDIPVVLNRDYFFKLEEGTATEVVPMSDYSVYAINDGDWAGLNLYAWGDVEAFGGWPGASAAEEIYINRTKCNRYAIPYAAEAKSLNLIFNGDGWQTGDIAVVANQDIVVKIGADKTGSVAEANCCIFVKDGTLWSDLYLYAWGDVEAFGGWPGVAPVGTVTIDSDTYKQFNLPSNAFNKNLNLIFNNNNGAQFDALSKKIDRDLYLSIDSSSATIIP